MARHLAFVGTLTIPISTNASNTLVIPQGNLSCSLLFIGPAAATGTISITGHPADTGTLGPLYVDATAQTLPATAVKRVNISGIKRVALSSGGTEAAERVVRVYAEFDL